MRFFKTLYSLSMWKCDYEHPFLVQYEIVEPRDESTHLYIVFRDIEEYRRSRYRTCHEVLISSNGWDREEDVIGHPAFDIDAPLGSLEGDWQKILEDDIIEVLAYLHPKRADEIRTILSDRDNFVWMSSSNDKKISRHLTVSNITFGQWRWTSKIMYRELMKKHPYIDNMIIRLCGSLRLPLNSKVGGSILTFQNNKHNFLDGLILIRDENSYTLGSLLMPSDLDNEFLKMDDIVDKREIGYAMDDEDLDEDQCSRCFQKLDSQFNTGLTMTGENGGFITLTRVRPGTCPISGRVHDSLGAYMFTRDKKVYFGCHRKCTVFIDGRERKCINISLDGIRKSDEVALSYKGEEEEET
jgi:hypothetical protein